MVLPQTETSSTIKYLKVDVRNKDDIRKTFTKIVEDFGRVDVMINGAAIIRETNLEETFHVNVVCIPSNFNIFEIKFSFVH